MIPSKHIKTLLNLTVYILGLFLLIYVGPKMIRFFLPFIIGWLISVIANPMVKFFEKNFKIMRKHGSWLVIVVVIGIIAFVGYLLGMWAFREGMALMESLSSSYTGISGNIDNIHINIANMFPFLPESAHAVIHDFFLNMDTYLGDFLGTLGTPILGVAGSVASNIPHLLVMGIFTFLASYFFIADSTMVNELLHKYLPSSFFDKWQWLKNVFSKAIGGYFIAQFKIMGVIAIIVWIGLMLLGVNYAILLAIIIAFLDFLPFFGTGFVIWPWCVYELLTGNFGMLGGLLAIYFVCTLVHQLLQPKFVGNTVGMDSFTTLICMFIGYRVSSVLGMILAVPVGIIIMNLYKEGAFNHIVADVKCMIDDFNAYRTSRG